MWEICMSGSVSGVWKRSHARTSEAPSDERGGNRYVRPTATAPHSDSTNTRRLAAPEHRQLSADFGHSRSCGRTAGVDPQAPFTTTPAASRVDQETDVR